MGNDKDTTKKELVGRILLVEDDEPQRKTLAGFLRKRGYQITEAESAAQALSVASRGTFDLLVTDLRLGGPDGVSLLGELRKSQPDLQALVLTAYGTVEDAVRAMRAGAYDFVTKPVELPRLEALLEKALERNHLQQENRELRQTIENTGAFTELVGTGPSMQAIRELALKVAPSRASVLITGESGTGKEVLARAIHRASPRANKPFVTLNCAALPESLIESELFGHEKGAFTGAQGEKLGRFELAHQGTLFLDEVGDIPLAVQVKLLNVLQSARFERVGGTATREVDVRILAATHRNLEQWIQEGRFRADLYYRLHVVGIHLPALRERPQDVPALVAHFLRKHSDLSTASIRGVEPAVLERLSRWPFPGNVRELENWIERAVVLAQGNVLTREDFPPQLFDAPADAPPSASNGGLEAQVEQLELTLIQDALRRHGGNKSAAARELKLTERAIRYKITKYGL